MNTINEINLALRDFSLGKKEASYKKLKKILKKNTNDNKLRFNLAVIAHSLNYNEEAKKNYKFLVKNNDDNKARKNLYILYINEKAYIKALNIIDELINNNSNLEGIIKDKAYILYKLKKYNESIDICKKILKNNDDINFFNILGLNYFAKNDFNKAEIIFKKALKIDSENTFILNSLGRMYHEKRDSKRAEKYLYKAYSLKKDSFEIINNLAGFYREEGEYNKSIELYNEALKIDDQNPTIINNLAKAYFDINKLDIAEKYCLKALTLNKNDGNVQKILSLIYLRQQNYKDGWSYFDGRLNLFDFIEKNSSINNIRKKILHEKKLNKEDKILVLREQGVGDEILYGTMYRDLLKSHKNITIECDKRLMKIFTRSFPEYKDSFLEFGKVSLNKDLLNNYDYVIYAGSLGKFFRNSIKEFGDGCYLKAEERLITKSKKKLKTLSNKINIGVSWKSFKNRYSSEKSLVLEDLNSIFETKNCNFINLQYGDIKDEISRYNKNYNKNIITIEGLDLFNDFDSLASLLKNLDLFITVSNSTAHLAGALGVKTLLIRPKNHAVFHYWNQPNNKTPWYKTITFLDRDKINNQKELIKKNLSC